MFYPPLKARMVCCKMSFFYITDEQQNYNFRNIIPFNRVTRQLYSLNFKCIYINQVYIPVCSSSCEIDFLMTKLKVAAFKFSGQIMKVMNR